MTNPTPKQMAMARRIAADLNARQGGKDSRDSEVNALREENARLRGALKDSARSLSWAARQMKGNCRGSDIDAVNLAAGRAANSAALTGRQG